MAANFAADLFLLSNRFSEIVLEVFLMSLLEYVRDVESPVAESICQFGIGRHAVVEFSV